MIEKRIIIAIFLIKLSLSYPDGLTLPESICQSGVPSHKGVAQPTGAYPKITLGQAQFKKGEQVAVQIKHNNEFKGIFLRAVPKNGNTPIGDWDSYQSDYGKRSCGDSSALVHKKRLSGHKSLTVYWDYNGDEREIEFLVTIVESFSKFWINKKSAVLTNLAGTTEPDNVVNKPVVTSNTEKYDRENHFEMCGKNQTCFNYPSSCNGADCEFSVGWSKIGETDLKMRMIMKGENSKYLAIGLSDDKKMGRDTVFTCQKDSKGKVSVGTFYNPKGHEASITKESNGITNINTWTGNEIACEFEMNPDQFLTSERMKRSIDSSGTHLIGVRGNVRSDGSIGGHGEDYHFLTKDKIDLLSSDYRILNGAGKTNYVIPHIILMLTAWYVLIPLGFFLARYHRVSLAKSLLLGKAAWFLGHVSLMICGSIIAWIGFILILVQLHGKWVKSSYKKLFAHSIIGMIALIVAIINPIGGIFRPNVGAKGRKVFNWVHRLSGLTGIILAYVNIIIGTYFHKPTKTDFNVHILAIMALVMFLTFLVLHEAALIFRRRAELNDRRSQNTFLKILIPALTAGHLALSIMFAIFVGEMYRH
ncbi:hypothetical protein SNEBB_010146 [Seison nebaliae]|nr:hypothetical protein SNEBB_010146 [Seison nebaliae]